ncbi:hypothetical protein GCM10027289_17380 [Tsukamurella serpentis]
MSRRDLLRGAAGLSLTTPLLACGSGTAGPVNLDELVADLSASLVPDQPYRVPTAQERATVVRGLRTIGSGGLDAARGELAGVGFRVEQARDEPSGQDLVVVRSETATERAWGTVVLSVAHPDPRVLIEVPHPRADMQTEFIGLSLLRAVPGAALLIAGAHRRADGGRADVAHNAESVFHQVAVDYSIRGAAQIQLHGYADGSLPGKDIVVSAGSGPTSEVARDIAGALGGAFDVCRAWTDRCGRLEGRSNVQGTDAAERGSVFVHLEANNTVRTRQQDRSEFEAALSRVLREIGRK